MKTLKILAALLFVSSVTMAQDINPSDVPTAVKTAFTKEYPNATDVEWEKKMDNYEVDFDLNRDDYEILYNPSGNVIKKEQDIIESALPQVIQNAIKTKYAGYKVDDVDMIWENNNTSYKIEVEKGEDEKTVIFDSNGKVLSERND